MPRSKKQEVASPHRKFPVEELATSSGPQFTIYISYMPAAVQALRGKTTGGGAAAAADETALSTWAHARAAQVLRKEAVSVALRWVSGAKTIQARTYVTPRGFYP